MKVSAKASLYIAGLTILLSGCGPWSYLASYEHDIRSATRDIETAHDDVHRSTAYTKRGSAYSEKARYSRAFKLIPMDEYARVFGQAIQDHDRAIALNSASAEAYFAREWLITTGPCWRWW